MSEEMSLDAYFLALIKRVEESDEIGNNGKDKNGFYKPVRTILLRHLQLLKDLHAKPNAKSMLKASWESVVETLPPEWLVLNEADKKELQTILN
jgi:hypothetical protein